MLQREEADIHGKNINERSHEAIRAYLRHRDIEVLEEGWAYGSDSIDFIAMDDEEIVFVDTATKCGGYDMPREEPNLERFEYIMAAYLTESGGGSHQHPLRHREPSGDGFREGTPAPPQERPQRREVTSKQLPRAFGLETGHLRVLNLRLPLVTHPQVQTLRL